MFVCVVGVLCLFCVLCVLCVCVVTHYIPVPGQVELKRRAPGADDKLKVVSN